MLAANMRKRLRFHLHISWRSYLRLCLVCVLTSTSTSSHAAEGFDFSEIGVSRDNQCERILHEEQVERIAWKKLAEYCRQQNLALKEAGMPYCGYNECYTQINLGQKTGFPFEIMLSNNIRRPSIFAGFVVYLDRNNGTPSISCHDVSLKGPFTLAQLDQLRDYMNQLELIKKCKISSLK